MGTDLSIYVNDVPLSHLGYWGDPVLTHRFPFGSWEMTWSADYRLGYRHPALVTNATVVAKIGPTRIWLGRLTVCDIAGGDFVAEGMIRDTETALAMNFTGVTSDLDEAIYFAGARGLLGFGTLSDFGPPMTDVGGEVNSVMTLMSAYQTRNATNFMVGPSGILYTIVDPVVPMIKVEPPNGELGVVDENYWTTLTAVYYSAPGTTALVTSVDNSQGADSREGAVDLTGMGVMTAPQAQAALDGILAKGLARTGFSDSVEVVNGQITNMGGTSVEPVVVARAMATTGVMARLTNMRDPRGSSLSTDVILGETVWNVGSDSIVLKPRGLTDRDLASVVESLGGALAA